MGENAAKDLDLLREVSNPLPLNSELARTWFSRIFRCR